MDAIAGACRTANPVFADNAPLDLSGVGPEFAGELMGLGRAAAAALTGARYERVRMYTAGGVGFVGTRTRNGVRGSSRSSPPESTRTSRPMV